MLTADDFEQWFRAHNERLHRQALGMLAHHKQAAEDAVADAWADAWAERDQWQDRGSGPLPWLTSLTKYAALAQIIDYRRHRLYALDDDEDEETDGLQPFIPDGTPYPGLSDPETHAALEEVWPRLTERQAVGVWCRCIGGYSPSEIAQILGLTVEGAHGAVRDGLAKITRYFQGDHSVGRDIRKACPRCGWGRTLLGHRTTCRPAGASRTAA